MCERVGVWGGSHLLPFLEGVWGFMNTETLFKFLAQEFFFFFKRKNVIKPNLHNFYKHVFRSSFLLFFLQFIYLVFNGEFDEVGYGTLVEVTLSEQSIKF